MINRTLYYFFEAKLEFKGKLPFVYLYCVVRDIHFTYQYYLKLHKNRAALNFPCWLVFFWQQLQCSKKILLCTILFVAAILRLQSHQICIKQTWVTGNTYSTIHLNEKRAHDTQAFLIDSLYVLHVCKTSHWQKIFHL